MPSWDDLGVLLGFTLTPDANFIELFMLVISNWLKWHKSKNNNKKQ